MIEKIGHYSITNPASVYDEEALTALELAGRTAAKVNEAVGAFNTLEEETGNHLQAQDTEITERLGAQDNAITKMNDETMPAKVKAEVQGHIDNGEFDHAISEYAGNLESRVDNLLGSVEEGSTTLDAELIDIRTDHRNKTHTNAGSTVRSLGRIVDENFSATVRKVSKNLINLDKVTSGFYVRYDNGEIEAHADLSVTDFIRIEGGKQYTFSSHENVPQMAFYDSDKNYISGISNQGVMTEKTVTAPDEAFYLRWSINNPYIAITQIEEGSIRTPYSEYEETLEDEILEEVMLEVSENYAPIASKNLIDSTLLTSDCYVDYQTGELKDLPDSHSTTDFIELEEGATYTLCVGIFSGVQQCAFYDEFKNYVTGWANSGVNHHITFVVPEGVKYVRWTIYNEYVGSTQLEKGGAATNFTPYRKVVPVEYLPEEAINEQIVFYVGEGQMYNSVLKALKETPASAKICIMAGNYDIYQEYLDYYGSDYWETYTGYEGEEDLFTRGLYLAPGREIYGETGANLVFNYSGNNENVKTYWSLIAPTYNNKISNLFLTISTNACRYIVHDDYASDGGSMVYEHCIFNGSPYANAIIGAGVGCNNLYVIKDCVFLSNTKLHDISYHGNTSGRQAVNKIFVTGCYGTQKLAFRWYGESTATTECIVSNSHFGVISCENMDGTQPYENMRMLKFNCTEG